MSEAFQDTQDQDSQDQDTRDQPDDEAVSAPAEPEAHEATGNAGVDGVLRSLDQLEDAPVAEHVAVFESAHEKLRSALADAGNDNAST